ncbi:hypothetical protein [Caldimonas sp. KR1-144]|uniref:hypothetical protein n=1 Tax=Caldimonas sp. KR1-144 TaxID=3400911 RepID=UPI003C0E9AF0
MSRCIAACAPLRRLLAVKSARLWMSIAIAILLPIKGAVAAAMLCSPGGPGMQVEERVDAPAGGQGEDEEREHCGPDRHGAPPGSHHASDQAGTASAHAGAGSCDACSALCSLTHMVGEIWSMPDHADSGTVVFPRLIVPAPSFLSGGQERPPRTT